MRFGGRNGGSSQKERSNTEKQRTEKHWALVPKEPKELHRETTPTQWRRGTQLAEDESQDVQCEVENG